MATKTATPPATSWDDVEQALCRKIDGVETFADADLLALSGIVGARLEDEINRMARVRSALAICPSREALEDAEAHAAELKATNEDAAAKLQAEADELTQKLAAIRSEISGLNSAVRVAESKVQTMQNARETLRKNIPPHIRETARRMHNEALGDIEQRIGRVKNAIHHNTFIATADLQSLDVLDRIANLQPGHPGYISRPKNLTASEFDLVIRREFPKLQPDAAAALPGLREELKELEAEKARRVADSVLVRDFYHR